MALVWGLWAKQIVVYLGFCLLFLAVAATTSADDGSSQARRHVIVGVPQSFPPYYRLDEHDNPSGFAVDAMNEVAKQAGFNVTYRVKKNWTEIFKAVRTGDIDIIPSLGISEDRKQYIVFTQPVDTFRIVLFVRNDTQGVTGIDDMAGRTVAVVVDNAAYRFLKKRDGVQLRAFAKFSDALFALLSGKTDAFAYPESVAWKLAREARVSDHIKVVAKPLLEIKRAMAVRKDKTELLAVLDRAVGGFVASPAYQKIYVAWFGKPDPYWTVARVFWTMSGFFIVLFLFMVWRRYRVGVRMIWALRESETRFKNIAETSSDRFWEMDENLCFTFDLVTHSRQIYPPPEDLVGRTRWDVVGADPDKDEKWRQHREDHLAHRPYRDFQFDITDANGGIQYRSVSGQPIFDDSGNFRGYRGSVTDITERKLAEESLKASQARLEEIFAIAPEAIVAIGDDMRVQLFNQAAERTFGYPAEEIIGQSFEILIPEEFRAGHRKHIENFAGSQQSYRMMGDRQDIAGLRKDGSIFPATASVSKLEIKEDTLFTVMLSDISERKASEAHLLQADKLATLGTLAAGTAHELSQPLNIIRLTTDSILFEAEANSSTASIEKKDLEGITAQVLRMAEIIDHMRVFSRKEDTLAELFMPTTVIGEALNLVKKQFAAVDISLERRLPDVCGLVRGSSGQLEQVILNLVTNACDAVEARLQQLAASNEKFHGKIGVELVDDDANDKIIISVTDNGGGIEESALKNIFDPFFTTKEAGKGTGLGLHVSYSIIDAMGGELEAHNGNVGACFTVSLPRAEQPQVNEPKPQQIERADEPVDQHRCSILVVDDEQQASNLLANTLRNRGHEVFTANNGAQALERFQVRPTDVVITDLQMPEMNGTILIDRLRQISPEVPIIVITGQVAAGENKADFEKQPRTFVLTKPIALPELMKALERVTN